MGQAKHVKKEAEAAEITAGAGGGGGAVFKAPQSVRPKERRWIATKNLAKKADPRERAVLAGVLSLPIQNSFLLTPPRPSSFLLASRLG